MKKSQAAKKGPAKPAQAGGKAASSEPIDDGPRKWLSVPEAGRLYYGLSRNGSYDAVVRGEIPAVRVGRLLKVPVLAMEQKLSEAGAVQPRPHKKQLKAPAQRISTQGAAQLGPSRAVRGGPSHSQRA